MTDLSPDLEEIIEARVAERTRELRAALDEAQAAASERTALEAQVRAQELELQAALAQAKESSASFAQVADVIDTYLWIAAPDLSAWHYVNPPVAELLGHSREQIYADAALIPGAFHPDDLASVLTAVGRVAAGHRQEVEFRLRVADGTYRWFWSTGYPDFDTDGTVWRIIGTAVDIHDRRQLEDELATVLAQASESNRRFELIADTIDTQFWITAPDLSVWFYVNPAVERAMGFTKEELYVDPMLLVHAIHPDDFHHLRTALSSIATGVPAEAVFRMRVEDGTYHWFWSKGYPDLAPDGTVVRVIGTSTDIHERKTLEAEVEAALEQASESSMRFEMIASTIDTNFWITAPDLSQWHYLNPPIAQMIGHTAEEVYANPALIIEAYHPDDTPLVFATLARVAHGEPAEVEHRMRQVDGTYRWLWSKGFPDYDGDGNVVRVVGTSTDITERKQLESELETALAQVSESNRRFEMIAGTIDTHFWVTVPDLSQWVYVNPAIADSLGYTVEEMYANPDLIPSLFHPDDVPVIEAALKRIAAGSREEFEFRCIVADGSYHWFWSKGYPDRDADGNITQIIGSSTDITEHKRLTAELQLRSEEALAASKAKSAFLATMTHELRTPVIGVTGMLEVLSHTELDAEQRRSVSIVRQSADSLLQILGDVLDVSKIEAGRLELAPTVTSLARIVEQVAHDFVHPASSKGILLTYDVDEHVSAAHLADALRLRQILANFTSNALKFTTEGTIHIALRVLDSGDHDQLLQLSVTDTGIGISPEHQAKLFEAFTQAESSTTRRFGGTGLGLNICRLLADLMGGDVSLASELGVGTTLRFRARLPIAEAALLPPEVPDGRPRALGRTRRTREEAVTEGSLLLLVEDHRINRLVLTQQLELAGFAVDVANDGAEGLQMWREGGYALVFTDLHMPVMDGRDLVRAIRTTEAEQSLTPTPVVGLTAAALRDELEACIDAGMDDVMLKPTSVPMLIGALRRWLPQLDWNDTAFVTLDDEPDEERSPAPDGNLRALLTSMAGGDAGLLAELLESFDTATRDDLDCLRRALGERDSGQVRHRAHRIKGSSRTIGAEHLAAVAQRLEDATVDGGWAMVDERAAALTAAALDLLDS